MSSVIEKDFYSIIKDIIDEETLYLRHFVGEIVDINDILNKGRIKIAIAELGFDTPDLGIWCNPRQGNSLTLPKVGQYAEVYFLNGDRTRPVYLYPVSEIQGNTPQNYTTTSDNIIFEDPNNPDAFIKYDSAVQLLQMFNDPNSFKIDYQNGIVTILNGTESFVLGDSFLSWLNNFITTIFNLHTHPYVDTPVGASVTSPPTQQGTSPTNILSQFIKGK